MPGRAGAVLLFVELLHAAEQIAQSLPVCRWELRIVLHLRQGFVHHLAPAFTGEHLLADGLHDRPTQDALHHVEFHIVGRVVEHTEFGFGGVRKQRVSGIPAEIPGDDDRDGRFPFANRLARGVERGRLHIEALLTRKLRDESPGDVATVLVNHQHGHFTHLRIATRPAEQVAEERRQHDGNQHPDDHGPAVVEKQFQILAH